MGFADIDTHLIEGEETWDFLDPSEEHHRPRVAHFQEAGHSVKFEGVEAPTYGHGQMWVVGDTWSPKLRSDSNSRNNANVYEPGSTQLSNASLRCQDMDALGVDVQLLISSFFIGTEIDHPLTEAALARSFNRWAASIAGEHKERFRWALRPPLRLLERAFEELEFGAANGASGVHLRGIEHGCFLNDPYFYPLYERAQDLNLAIIVHVGTSHRRSTTMPIGKIVSTPPAFMEHLHSFMAGFHAVVSSDEIQRRFPRLRWGFVEGGSTWVPAVLQKHARLRASSSTEFMKIRPITPEELEAKNIFVACEVDEDLPYLIDRLGENVLCAGSDYGHNDAGTDLAAHAAIMMRTDISETAARKIVDTNGRRLLGLPIEGSNTELLRTIPDDLPNVRAAADDRSPVLISR